jgi:hypothetical protein
MSANEHPEPLGDATVDSLKTRCRIARCKVHSKMLEHRSLVIWPFIERWNERPTMTVMTGNQV